MGSVQLSTSLIAILFIALSTPRSIAQNHKNARAPGDAKCSPNSTSTREKAGPAKYGSSSKRVRKRQNASAQASNTNSITGTYESGNDALGSELKVQELAGGKMKFYLYSFWRCPDGTACNGIAESTIPVSRKKAIYHQADPEYTLQFAFSKNACTVECDKPSNFGGFNVDPSANYKKSRAKVDFD